MSRYREAFETLAERGTAVGSMVLLERIDASPTEPTIPVSRPRPRALGGLAVAVAAFFAVIAVGSIWVLLRPSGDVANQDHIEWTQAPGEAHIGTAVSGPGGFLLWPKGILGGEGVSNGGAALQFSPDAESWTNVTPAEAAGAVARAVVASGDRWMLQLDSPYGQRALVSADARSWEAVTLPANLEPFLAEVMGAGTGFFAVGRDPLGEGTTLWWSPDGFSWSKSAAALPGPLSTATIEGTDDGLVWYTAISTDETQHVYHTADGTSWVEGEITLPPEHAEALSGWILEPVAVADGTWFAIGQVLYMGETGSRLLVWTSPDGITWQYRGSPEFGSLAGYSVGIATWTVIGDRLVVEPDRTQGGEFIDGGIRFTSTGGDANVGTLVTGDLWASGNGATWSPTAQLSFPVVRLSGLVTDSGSAVGLYVPAPATSSSDSGSPVTTTMAAIDPSDLDPKGVELQDAIVADGRVTREELIRALEGWKSCMERLGIAGATYELDPDGSYGFSWPSPGLDTGTAEDNFCTVSYLEQVAYTMWHQE